jgi:hypothetical protein
MTDAKQYGLKVIHKPSNMVRSEKWFDTTRERTAAMSGSTLEPHYIYVLMERDTPPPDSPGEEE